MAEKRMFSKKIVLSDAFLDMPLSARCLYFAFGMFADDDGFINNAKSIMRQVGTVVEDLNILLEKKFILAFESGVIVIKHWRINNTLRKDRYTPTNFQEELSSLAIKENSSYTFKKGVGCHLVATWLPDGCHLVATDKNRIGKVRLDKYTPCARTHTRETDVSPSSLKEKNEEVSICLENKLKNVEKVEKADREKIKADSIEVLKFLNEKVGANFKEIDCNLKYIGERLREGYSVSDLEQVVKKKSDEWKGTKMQVYLRPETLFSKHKFEGYLNQRNFNEIVKHGEKMLGFDGKPLPDISEIDFD